LNSQVLIICFFLTRRFAARIIFVTRATGPPRAVSLLTESRGIELNR
jgi:hypothetical protein